MERRETRRSDQFRFTFYLSLLLGLVAGSYFPGNAIANGGDDGWSASWDVVGKGEVQARDGTPLSFTGYKSKDGVTLTVIYGRFSSSERANTEVDAQMKEARSIISKETQRDSRGKINHRRLVAMIAGDNPKSVNAAILWTQNDEFHEIVSSSMAAALQWEKKLGSKESPENPENRGQEAVKKLGVRTR